MLIFQTPVMDEIIQEVCSTDKRTLETCIAEWSPEKRQKLNKEDFEEAAYGWEPSDNATDNDIHARANEVGLYNEIRNTGMDKSTAMSEDLFASTDLNNNILPSQCRTDTDKFESACCTVSLDEDDKRAAEDIVRKLCKNGKLMEFQEGEDFIKVMFLLKQTFVENDIL